MGVSNNLENTLSACVQAWALASCETVPAPEVGFMASTSRNVLPDFDFGAALRIDPSERMRVSVDTVRDRFVDDDAWDGFGLPPVPPTGSSPDELLGLESRLGVHLPVEYRNFLERWRYLILSRGGYEIWGLTHEGLSSGSPWVSDGHRLDIRYLVFADYWRFADGDQLMFDLDDPCCRVVAYLHEHGPLYEMFAPSFSLALWRMVFE